MSTALADEAAGAAAAGMAALGKRKIDEVEQTQAPPDSKTIKTEDGSPMPAITATVEATVASEPAKKPSSKARELRLEQNRKAARESRRRKKTMIEELQRSVIFFSRANSTLKQQNDELSGLLMQSQAQVAAIESGQQPAPPEQPKDQPQQLPVTQGQPAAAARGVVPPQGQAAPSTGAGSEESNAFQQAQAQAVATQAVLESQVGDSDSVCSLFLLLFC